MKTRDLINRCAFVGYLSIRLALKEYVTSGENGFRDLWRTTVVLIET